MELRTAREVRSGGGKSRWRRPRRRSVGPWKPSHSPAAISPRASSTPRLRRDAPRVLTCDQHGHRRAADGERARARDRRAARDRRRRGASAAAWGILSDRDVLRCAARSTTASPTTSRRRRAARAPDDRLDDVAERMLDQHTSHAVVVEPRTDRPSACCRRSTSPASSAGDAAEHVAARPAGPDEVARTAAELIATACARAAAAHAPAHRAHAARRLRRAARAAARGELPSGARHGVPARRVPSASAPDDERSFGAYLRRELARHRRRRVPRARRRGAPIRPPSATRHQRRLDEARDRPRRARPRPRRARRLRRAGLAPGRAARASSRCTRRRAPTRPRSSAASSTSRPTRSRSACARCSPPASCCVLVTGAGKARGAAVDAPRPAAAATSPRRCCARTRGSR